MHSHYGLTAGGYSITAVLQQVIFSQNSGLLFLVGTIVLLMSREKVIFLFTNRRDARFGYMELSLFHAAAVYIAVINVVTFIVYAVDKWKARRMACGEEHPAGIGVHGRHARLPPQDPP